MGVGSSRAGLRLQPVPELSDADVVAVTRPLSTRATRRHLVAAGWETLRELEATGELRIEGCRVLSPSRAGSDVHPSDLARGSLVTDPDSDRGLGGQPWAGRLGAADPR